MNQADNFEIKYWGEEFNNLHLDPQRHGRSIKQKLVIIFSFIAVLAVLPTLIFGISNLQSDNPKIVTTSQIEVEPSKAPQVKIAEQKPSQSEVVVVNNDSYWKISKRVCGTGKYYLSIRDQNQGKALYKDDLVKVNCSL